MRLSFLFCVVMLSITTCFGQVTDNLELKELYRSDQADRFTENADWDVVSKNDRLRQARVYELLDSSKVITAPDYSNAAMIFQHGEDSVSYGMAVKLMRKAIELNPAFNKWLLAAAIDRELQSRGKPQIYGTQYMGTGVAGKWKQYLIDTTQITDSQRVEYGVETLAQQREKLREMNKKSLSALQSEGKSVEAIIQICRSEREKGCESEHNFSENGLNYFGYSLMGRKQFEEALLVFNLYAEFYPTSSNAYDSLGECLLSMNRKEEGIAAYRRSLALDPKNRNAERVIIENSGK